MKERTVYIAGYSGREPSWLLSACLRLDGVVWDIRYSPRSRHAEWKGTRLAALLGDRYRWIPEWGNLLYKTQAIQLADPDAGLAAWDQEHRPVILLCQCRKSASCHRSTVAELLMRQRRVQVRELDHAFETDRLRQLNFLEGHQ